MDRAIDINLAGVHADLALVEKRTESRCFHRLFDIGIGQHQHRIEPAQFHYHPLECAPGALAEDARGLVRSGEVDATYRWAFEEHVGNCGGRAGSVGDDVERAFGKARLFENLGVDQAGRHRRLFRRFDYRGVAEGHRQQKCPPGQIERSVPGGEPGDDAQRLARDHGHAAGDIAVHQIAIGQIAPTRRLAQHRDRQANLEDREHSARPGFGGHDRDDLFETPLGYVGGPEEQPLAFAWRQGRPRRECRRRGGDRPLAFGAAPGSDFSNHRAIKGIAVGKGRAADGIPCPVDKVRRAPNLR